jgi:protein TilB
VQRCESLERLDLTANFVPKSSLSSVFCLARNIHFRELHLLGNPCTEWECYRAYVIANLPQLQKLVSFTLPFSQIHMSVLVRH